MRNVLIPLGVAGLLTAVGAHGVPLLAFVDEQPTLVDACVAGGAVMIFGGGAVTPEIRKRFVELAGGASARIVLIPGYDPGPDGEQPLLTALICPGSPLPSRGAPNCCQ